MQKLEAYIEYFDKMSEKKESFPIICRLSMPMYPKKVVKIFTNWQDSLSLFLHLTDNLGEDSDALDAARLHDKVGERGGEEGGELHLHGAQARVGAEVRHHQVSPHQEEARVDVVGPHLAQARHNTPPAAFFYNIITSVADPDL